MKAWLVIFGALAALGGIAVWMWPRPPRHAVEAGVPGNLLPRQHAAQAAAIERREKAMDQTIWAKEMLAQEHGRVLEEFWDRIRVATNKLGVVGELHIGALKMGGWEAAERLPLGIERLKPGAGGKMLTEQDWQELLRDSNSDGWRLAQGEIRHHAFDPATNGFGARSRFYVSAHLTNSTVPSRTIIEGEILVAWTADRAIQWIDASQLEIRRRSSGAGFTAVLEDHFETPPKASLADPLIVRDLDGDGYPEIAIPAANRLYRRTTNGAYRLERFFKHPPDAILAGLIADFDGDGVADFLHTSFDGLFLIRGISGGSFENPARLAWRAPEGLPGARVMTCGDVDGDGDLDVFIGQYKGPFVDGTMPTPYYDARDSYPSYFLINEGNGRFADRTAEAGLSAKRNRHVYAASLVDLDGDRRLDLATSSDFAGADVYQNAGGGRFVDVTEVWLENPQAFGMGHVFADFNNDGALDFLMTGMTSATVDRLEHLGLQRPSAGLIPEMRKKMAWGNRLYLRDTTTQATVFRDGGALSKSIARSGWSWGVAAADFDNDGWTDVYVANGMESKSRVRDYEGEFWLHDIFVANSSPNPAAQTYLVAKGNRTRGAGDSFGGFDKNRLFLNLGGVEFVEAAHLLGVAMELDGRNLVAADVNGDGRMDLIVMTFAARPESPHGLHVFENRIEEAGNWIAVAFPDEKPTTPRVGIRVELRSADTAVSRQIITGDSYRSQHPDVIHFGLGENKTVNSINIEWPSGKTTELINPEANQIHTVVAQP